MVPSRLLLLLFLLLPPGLQAAEVPTFDDCKLAVQARLALQRDRALEPHRLGVSVKRIAYPSQGWALENLRLPPMVLKTPTLASAKVPRRGASSTPFEGTPVRGGAGRPASISGSPARAAPAAKSRVAARTRIIARCS